MKERRLPKMDEETWTQEDNSVVLRQAIQTRCDVAKQRDNFNNKRDAEMTEYVVSSENYGGQLNLHTPPNQRSLENCATPETPCMCQFNQQYIKGIIHNAQLHSPTN